MKDTTDTDCPHVICILGMHRCGTSLVTRLVNLLGVHLGAEENLSEASPILNPVGFWEHNGIYRLNERILAELGGSWHEPPDFPPGWESSELLSEIRHQARALIESDFAGAALWAWKDPRACLLLPFWKAILPRMKYVVCLRNPVEVALSLHWGHKIPLERGARLWLEYVRCALENSSGEPRFFIFYEDFLANPDRHLSDLAAFIGLPGRERDPEIRRSIDGFISKELRHHRLSVAEAIEELALSFPVKSLYLALRFCLREGLDHGELDTSAAKALETFGTFAARTVRESAVTESEIERLSEQSAALSSRLAEVERAIVDLTQQANEKDATIHALSGQIGERDNLIASLDRQLAERNATILEREATIQAVSAELEDKASHIARFSSSVGGRLLARYGRFKYRYLLPLYRLLKK